MSLRHYAMHDLGPRLERAHPDTTTKLAAGRCRNSQARTPALRSAAVSAASSRGVPAPRSFGLHLVAVSRCARLGLCGAVFLLATALLQAQEALRNSLAGDAAAEARRTDLEKQPFTFKTGDFRMLVTPSLGLDWNDNVNISSGQRQQDFILTPLVGLDLSYPLTHQNVLRFNASIGYDYYLEHTEFSGARVLSGSGISLDTYIKDFWINLHDRFQYTQDSAGQASLANNGRYGGFDNTLGAAVTWDLQDVVLNAGYDHENSISSSSAFDYLDRSSESVVGRAGFRILPTLTTGPEASGSSTDYDKQGLNDSKGYSAGLYADWRPGHSVSLQVRGGYTAYFFDQTSLTLPAQNQHAWYADATVSHDVSDSIAYSFTAGRELRLGIQADAVESWYLRPNITWRFIKNLPINTWLSYEHGSQSLLPARLIQETYDYLGVGLGIGYDLTKKLRLGVTYRLTLRSTDASFRDYSQNVIGLRLTYLLQ